MKKLACILGISILLIISVSACSPDGSSENVYKDGTFEAVSQESRGYAKVNLTIKDDEITGVSIVEYTNLGEEKIYEIYGERFPELKEAHNTLASHMVEQNTWDVDDFTGATSTSTKVREAAKLALQKAQVEPVDSTYFDGTFMGISDRGERGWGIALVTIKDDKITAIELKETTPRRDEDGENMLDSAGNQLFAEKDEDYGWEEWHEARVALAESMLESQGTDVDDFTGATSSSEKWKQAFERALEAAKTK